MLSDVPFALAFGAGMLSAFNPCGFAMLPAYLGWFLGIEGQDAGPAGVHQRPGVGRSLVVGACVSGGFVGVFAVIGIITRQVSDAVLDVTPYLTVGLGLVMIPLGVAMAAGRQLKLRLPTVKRGPQDRTYAAVVLFGASYAVVSLGCTLPTFMIPVAGTLSQDLLSGVVAFVAYSAGIALVLMSLTLAIGLARGSIVRNFRRVLPYVGRASGVLLVLTGAYVAYYGWYEIEVVLRGNTDFAAGPVDWLTARTDELATWVDETGETRLGLILAGLLAAVIATTFARSRLRRT